LQVVELRQVRMRSPSGWADGRTRGLAPGGDQHDIGFVLAGGAVGGGLALTR